MLKFTWAADIYSPELHCAIFYTLWSSHRSLRLTWKHPVYVEVGSSISCPSLCPRITHGMWKRRMGKQWNMLTWAGNCGFQLGMLLDKGTVTVSMHIFFVRCFPRCPCKLSFSSQNFSFYVITQLLLQWYMYSARLGSAGLTEFVLDKNNYKPLLP